MRCRILARGRWVVRLQLRFIDRPAQSPAYRRLAIEHPQDLLVTGRVIVSDVRDEYPHPFKINSFSSPPHQNPGLWLGGPSRFGVDMKQNNWGTGGSMLDVVSVLSFLIFFPVCLLYLCGCDHLKGKRQ